MVASGLYQRSVATTDVDIDRTKDGTGDVILGHSYGLRQRVAQGQIGCDGTGECTARAVQIAGTDTGRGVLVGGAIGHVEYVSHHIAIGMATLDKVSGLEARDIDALSLGQIGGD